ncbi:AmmeMemoRadiSam system protein B [Luteolibacter ambystomatis]|uniref:AmmeMemoRadiSam system protein B n=2 Tax=Luteolibacter ambystomatis TaxID=2824561 RepID=A0A975IZL3_9BACT|nr:AmmeMemoRadiSam system protein B [Luteolibacter ambystomatis]QUE49815.1 AmmeMemoRadiSam system protein B [Luteolibacter ambystomatis]
MLRAAAAEPYPLFYDTSALFLPAIISAEKNVRPLEQPVTGVTVPHHLLAADMIADTLRLASAHRYKRILLLSPDHFRRGTTPCSTTTRPFKTVLGDVPVDEAAVRALLGDAAVSESSLFSHEHGIQAILPFLARWFPGTPVVPMTLDIRSKPEDWPALAQRLKPLVTPDTLIVQSTDFSHYLPQPAAAERDQQTMRLLACGDAAGIPALGQPQNLDSKACQWLHMTLEREVNGIAAPVVVDNRNAIRYGGRRDEPRTTSYITQVYSPRFIPASSLPGEAWFFGGDTQFGRNIANLSKERLDAMFEKILAVTGSRPLVVNLEGVVLDDPPSGQQHPMRIGMASAITLEQLHKLHVAAVSIANNHSLDYGREARKGMKKTLADHGIVVLDEGTSTDLGPFRIGTATDVINLPSPANAVLAADSFDVWKQPDSKKPLFAFLHAGIEYRDAPGARERWLAEWTENAGAALVIGSHPHRPSKGWERSEKSLRFYSMGNLIFDQSDPANSGGLVEVRFFEQGTWAARWLPLGNLYRNSK